MEKVNWVADATGHWKECEECDEKLQAGDHTLNDEDKCTVCKSDIADFGDFVSVFTYDEHDSMIRTAEYDVNGNMTSECVYENEYDTDGNLIKVIANFLLQDDEKLIDMVG